MLQRKYVLRVAQVLGDPLPLMRVATTIASLLLLGCAVLALVKDNSPARSLFNVPMVLPHGGWMPQSASRFMPPQMQHGGKGFGGGEATRDPAPTVIDPNDPKAKQTAIHKAESFADYLAKRSGGGGGAAPAPAPPAAAASAPAPAPAARVKPEGGKGRGLIRIWFEVRHSESSRGRILVQNLSQTRFI